MEELLAALDHQTITEFEVILVDDGSTDGSVDRVRPRPWLSVLRVDARNSYVARNRGVSRATADVLAFCDADCIPEPTWLEEGVRAMGGPARVLAGEIALTCAGGQTVWSLADSDLFLNQAVAVGQGRAVTANLFVSTEVFRDVGGFDESLPSGGDFDFTRRCGDAGWPPELVPAARVRHPVRRTRQDFLEKLWRVARATQERAAASGRLRTSFRPAAWIPAMTTIHHRRRVGKPVWLDLGRLDPSEAPPPLRLRLGAVAVVHLGVQYAWLAAAVVVAVRRRLIVRR